MEKYKKQIEKEANELYPYEKIGYKYKDDYMAFDKYEKERLGFISGVNSKISERIKVEFAISVLENISVCGDIEANIQNKITELKNSINGK